MSGAAASSNQRQSGQAASAGTGDASDWKRQKEEKARLRKAANDLKKCEERISLLEEESASIDEQMVLPENCTDVHKLEELSLRKAELEQELETLYQKWEEMSEQL